MSNEPDEVSAEVVDEPQNLPAVIRRDASNYPPVELPNRQDILLESNPERRCVATNSRGVRCRKFAIYGSTVCRMHGGAVKRVKEAARIRVENASNRLMRKLIEFAFDDTNPPDVQLKAIQNSLDRAGLKPPAEVVLSQGDKQPYEEVFEYIAGGSRNESRKARGLPPLDEPGLAGYESGSATTAYPPAQRDTPTQDDQQREPSLAAGSLLRSTALRQAKTLGSPGATARRVTSQCDTSPETWPSKRPPGKGRPLTWTAGTESTSYLSVRRLWPGRL
jgi:hypothetical protein